MSSSVAPDPRWSPTLVALGRAGGVPDLCRRSATRRSSAGSSRRSRSSCRSASPPADRRRRGPLPHRRRPGARRHLPAPPGPRRGSGVLVFCHEYLSDRWSFRPTPITCATSASTSSRFDFRNHGESDERPATTSPLQWVTDHEVRDLRGGAGLPPVPPRSRSGRVRPLRDQPGRGHRPGRRGRGPRRLGRRHRRSLPDPRDDARLHPPLGGDLCRQSVLLEADAALGLRLRRLDRAGCSSQRSFAAASPTSSAPSPGWRLAPG